MLTYVVSGIIICLNGDKRHVYAHRELKG
jgi:hypothetical protein